MARKPKKHPTEVNHQAVKASSSQTNRTLPTILVLALILIVTVVAYLPVFDSGKEFTNWDDGAYVTEQPLVQEFTRGTIGEIFDPQTSVSANYHPLTILSLAVTHELFGMSAQAFAGGNLLFHILNTMLVFFFIAQLVPDKTWVAALTALWFGIHPMHVESVAWVSERKDVLYTFFLLLSLISYTQYVHKRQLWMLGLSLLAFVGSCLSKAMAVPLPIVLFLLDYWHERRIDGRSILEKIPFLAVSLVVGLLALSIQSTVAVADAQELSFIERLAFASTGFVLYWVKMVVPTGLSAFYPYPVFDAGNSIPGAYLLMPVVAVAICAVPVLLSRSSPDFRRVIVFGVGFFVLFVALVLQVLQVGNAMMADRYTYVPYIGGFFIVAVAVDNLVRRFGNLVLIGVLLMSAILIPMTQHQVTTWANSGTLWENVIRNHEERGSNEAAVESIGVAYVGRGTYRFAQNDLEGAFNDFRSVENSRYMNVGTLQRLSTLYRNRGDAQSAVRVLNRALELDPTNVRTLWLRGLAFSSGRSWQQARADFETALRTNPTAEAKRDCLVALTRVCMEQGRFDDALGTCTRTTAEFPTSAEAWYLQGILYGIKQQHQMAASSLRRSVEIGPNSAASWYNLALAELQTGNRTAARTALDRARALGHPIDPAIEARLH